GRGAAADPALGHRGGDAGEDTAPLRRLGPEALGVDEVPRSAVRGAARRAGEGTGHGRGEDDLLRLHRAAVPPAAEDALGPGYGGVAGTDVGGEPDGARHPPGA